MLGNGADGARDGDGGQGLTSGTAPLHGDTVRNVFPVRCARWHHGCPRACALPYVCTSTCCHQGRAQVWHKGL